MKLRIYSLVTVILFRVVSLSFAQTTYVPIEEEAPEALIQTQLGDAGVSLFLDGFWEMYLTGSMGLSFVPGTDQPLFRPFPGMSPGISFRQVPDLTLFLLIDDRYSFEATVLEGYELNRFILGYDGKKNEPLQSVRIGNADINLSSFPLLPFGDIPKNAIGASATFLLGTSEHELALRFQPAGAIRKTYIGNNELLRIEISPADFIAKQYFVLPDSGVADLEIFIEKPEGPGTFDAADGRTYGAIGDNVVEVSENSGTLRFAVAPAGRVLVFYQKNGFSVGHDQLGSNALVGTDVSDEFLDVDTAVNFSFRNELYFGKTLAEYGVSDGSRTLLLIYDPGSYAPFEHTGYYSVPYNLSRDSSRVTASIEIQDSSGARSVDPLDIRITDDPSVVRLGQVSTLVGNADSPNDRYPLVSTRPEIYGPNRDIDGDRSSDRILVDILIRVEQIILDRPVPGSVRIHVNGEPEFRFGVDDSGVVELRFTPLSTDRIDVSYTSNAFAGIGTDIAIGYGTHFRINDSTEAIISAGSFWNATNESYSDRDNIHPGSMVSTASLVHKTEHVTIEATAGISVTSPDTSGVFRILGSVSSDLSVPILASNVFPASPPKVPLALQLHTGDNRGRLLYKDYTSFDVGGVGVLNQYNWIGITSDRISPYETGGISGPYLTSAIIGNRIIPVATLDFEFIDGDTWVGGMIRTEDPEIPFDASAFTGIEFSWRMAEEFSGVIHVQIGAHGEDLDTDGILDAETGIDASGFLFNDSSQTLRVGTAIDTGNGFLDTEDANRNGFLDQEIPSSVVTRTFVSSDENYPESEEFQSVKIRFTSDERKALSLVRSIRLIIENDGTQASTGKLLVGDIVFTGEQLGPTRTDSSHIIVEAIDTGAIIDDLESSFSSVATRFHNDGIREITKIAFTDEASIRPLQIVTRVDGPSAADYRSIEYYVRGSDSTAELALVDSLGRGIAFSIDVPNDGQWHRAVYNYRDGEVFLDGVRIPDASISYNPDSSILRHLNISITAPGSGEIYIDEIQLSGSYLHFGAGGDISATVAFPGVLLGTDDVSILSDASIHQTFSGASRGFTPSSSENTSDYFRSRSVVSGTLVFFRADLLFDVSFRDGGESASGGHSLTLPSVPFPVRLFDSFVSSGSLSSRSYIRGNGVSISISDVAQFDLDATIESGQESFSQNWRLSGALSPSNWLSSKIDVAIDQFSPESILEHQNHFLQLTNSYARLYPLDTSISDRDILMSTGLSLKNEIIGLSIEPTLHFFSEADSQEFLNIDGVIHVTIPFSPKLSYLNNATLSVDRAISAKYPSANLLSEYLTLSPRFAGDIAAGFHELRNDGYLFEIPIVDLFSKQLATNFIEQTGGAESAIFSTAVSATFSRILSASIASSVLPYSVSILLERKLTTNYFGIQDGLTVSSEFHWKSINIFGKYGNRPLTDIFESDEYSIGINGAFSSSNDDEVVGALIELQSSAGFFEDKNTFHVSNIATADVTDVIVFDDSLELNLSFRQILKNGINLPFLNVIVESDVYFTHSESLVGRWSGIDKGISLLIGHKSILTIAEYGFISASGGFGFNTTQSDLGIDQRIWSFGLEGGIEVHISL